LNLSFTTLDLVVFFAFLILAMAVGFIAGRKEDTSEDYFLAGRKIPWWGVAASIFGSNVSANHVVGMMGIGFSVGFAQSHFELGAIAGLMLLCYGFLPVYRKLNLYTLSEYLGRRYDDRSRIAYAVIMVVIMAIVQMVPGLYIGARSICVLARGDAVGQVTEKVETDGVEIEVTRQVVDRTYYNSFVIALAVIAASYTILGGLKAVVWTDVIQSVLLLAAGILVAILVFQAVGGWGAMRELDRAGADKMHLYLPSDHATLPWTGVLTGLMAMHFFYWGTNQFIVQRALAARSDREARLGIVAAGFLKLLIPFFAIASGVAAVYMFQQRVPGQTIAPDTAFTAAVSLLIPAGYGLMGLIAAGLIGAILSSIDSMMNSAATIVTVDVYQRYVKPTATDRQMIGVGRWSIVGFVTLAALMAIFVLDPNSDENFFLTIADQQNYLTPGLLVAFALGMFWRRATAQSAFVTILAGVVFSGALQWGYDVYHAHYPGVAEWFGKELAFFHRVVVVILLCVIVQVVISLLTPHDREKARLNWTDLGGHAPRELRNLCLAILLSLVVFAALGWLMVRGSLSPPVCALIGGFWTLALFSGTAVRGHLRRTGGDQSNWLAEAARDDHVWAGLLCSLAVGMMYYFY